MSYATASVQTSSGLDILKAIKGLLKTGWTLDEETGTLWKDTPAAFPVGLTTVASGSSSYIAICVKDSSGATVAGSALSSSYNISSGAHYIWVYTSPNGSVGISINATSSGFSPLIFTFAKNSNTDARLPTYIPCSNAAGNGNTTCLIPGSKNSPTMPSISTTSNYGLNIALCSAVDPYTGTALADVYMTAVKTTASVPDFLSNGSYRFVRIGGSGSFYLRYV